MDLFLKYLDDLESERANQAELHGKPYSFIIAPPHRYGADINGSDTNMPLTDIGEPAARIVTLSDGGGLQLWVTPDDAKRWRLAYWFGGSQASLAIGVYPANGVREAPVSIRVLS
jgi:hypothetical protein